MDEKELKRVRVVKRIAQELPDGALVNLGIGMPTLVADYIPAGRKILLQSENGFIGLGPQPQKGKEDPRLVNAGGLAVSIVPGGCFFDSSMSFAIIRGGHVDYTVLGALEVDEQGNLANYMIPGKMVPGMGGAMDLVAGARNVIVSMEHVNKNGAPKILKKCTLPLTAVGEVDLIVTDMAFIRVTKKGLVLEEIAENTTVEEVIKNTGAKLHVAGTLRRF
ncbi:MAG: succinyl-CoA--3-ketoacid-CoA transferase [Elusimicrobia bacterium GWC2_51_8]|nr:MAG: succinyl-CoA--3-ketoacid-CoA transferase [Elusimicrobia bacterium GWA2_51_34]OGR58184.1 MAG: succinyl-CoA--3-ketoacid-CoA transferase [Elusimicrobia bacterium GWC2_51_8]OGR84617.1 MAG: succinyl-CoA--3-ketoacid-CoA transferase [Elusimicrobia bacterium GWF2_52_66]HCE97545.1 succinyl-CoA--3-ketoacid-CoA transferase [Elusimicrobiota bacterium]